MMASDRARLGHVGLQLAVDHLLVRHRHRLQFDRFHLCQAERVLLARRGQLRNTYPQDDQAFLFADLIGRNPVSVHHSCKKMNRRRIRKKSGVGSSFLREKMNRHRITRTPDYAPDTVQKSGVSSLFLPKKMNRRREIRKKSGVGSSFLRKR